MTPEPGVCPLREPSTPMPRRRALWVTALCAVSLFSQTAAAQGEAAQPAPAQPPPAEAVPAPAPPPPAEAVPAPAPAEAALVPPPAPGVFEAAGLTWKPALQVRLRGEGRFPTYTAAGDGPNSTFVDTRIRPSLEVQRRVGAVTLSAGAALQDARRFGVAPSPAGPNGFGLFTGYFDIAAPGVSVRAGRQVLSYHRQRLIGELDWAMSGRSFDAVKVRANFGDNTLDVFGALMAPHRTVEWSDLDGTYSTQSRGDYLAGAVLSLPLLEALSLDLYAFYRHDGPATEAPTRDRDVVSPGVFVKGALTEALSYELEGTVQLGQVVDELHLAYGFAGDVFLALGTPAGLTLSLGGVIGSGAKPNGNVDGLDNFFPTNHAVYGFMDLFGWQNHVEGHVRADLNPAGAKYGFRLDVFQHGLQSASAAWINAGGVPLGVDPTGDASRYLGTEVDATFAWKPIGGFTLSGGYSIFVPGEGARDRGHDDPMHWVYLMSAVAFP